MSDTVPSVLPSTVMKKKKKSSSAHPHHSANCSSASAATNPTTAVTMTSGAAVPPVAKSTPSPPTMTATSSPDAILDLIGSRIDHLEESTSALTKEQSSQPTAEEMKQVKEKMKALKEDESIEKEKLFQFLQDEMTHRLVAQRQFASSNEKLFRLTNQKKSLENLCKELQHRNKTLSNEVRLISVEQSKAHADMKSKFESNLQDIQLQLNKHTEDRLAQASENEKLRENLAQLLKFDGVREEHFNQQLKTKELEIKLLEAKLAQQTDFAAQEVTKSKVQAEKIEYLQTLEQNLRAQLNGYAEKFENVQTTLTKSNELFGSFKAEMEKSSAQLRKLESEKLALEKSHAQSKLQLIQMAEAKVQDDAAIEKVKRQNIVLTNLCKQLQAKQQASSNTNAETTEQSMPASATAEAP